jgi:hypothetical protein
MRVFIVVSALAVLWMLGAVMFKVLRALGGLMASKLPNDHMGSASGKITVRLIASTLGCMLWLFCAPYHDNMTCGCQMQSDDSEKPGPRARARGDLLIFFSTTSRSRRISSALQ